MPYLIIGMIQGSHAGNYLGEFVGEDGTPNRISDSQFNAGISIAIPIDQILEITRYENMTRERREVIDARLARVGYRPSGRSGSAVPQKENPRHREDFTSLLNAAARKKPQGGQTSPDESGGNSSDT